jgi:6-phosphogluconolactonase (cycloisomerase 2 family)
MPGRFRAQRTVPGLFALALLSVVLTQCGGGGSSGGAAPNPTPIATVSPTPSPTPRPGASLCSPPSQMPGPATSSVYVADPSAASVSAYAAGSGGPTNEAPFARIFGNNTALAEPFGIALDVCGNIYVANVPQFHGAPGNNILVFAANPSGSLNEAPVATIPVGGQVSGGIAVDSSGKIYVGITSNTGAIDVFAPVPAAGGTLNEAPLATITGSNTGFGQSVGMIALDASGRIYTASAGGIGIFAANPSGTLNEAPVAMIAGSNTGLQSPISISFDPSGNIYVANNLNNSVTVYAANPSGLVNEAPLGTIAGSNTGLSNVQCITVDATGRVYVGNRPLNGASASVTVYPPNPSGTLNETPLETITGSNTGLINPTGIVFHAVPVP